MAGRKPDYPSDWQEIRLQILKRAGHRCEGCGALEGEAHPLTGKIVRLQIAHLNHDTSDNRPANLKALCPRDHTLHDQEMRLRVWRWRREQRRRTVQPVLPFEETE